MVPTPRVLRFGAPALHLCCRSFPWLSISCCRNLSLSLSLCLSLSLSLSLSLLSDLLPVVQRLHQPHGLISDPPHARYGAMRCHAMHTSAVRCTPQLCVPFCNRIYGLLPSLMCAMQCSDVLCCAVLCCVMLCCAVRCGAVLWCAVLCCAALCCGVPCGSCSCATFRTFHTGGLSFGFGPPRGPPLFLRPLLAWGWPRGPL